MKKDDFGYAQKMIEALAGADLETAWRALRLVENELMAREADEKRRNQNG